MPRYQIECHETAKRELNGLNQTERDRITDVITSVAECREPTTHEKTKHLEGHTDLFRVRVGQVRAIARLEKPSLQILKVGKRRGVYQDVDELTKQRLTS